RLRSDLRTCLPLLDPVWTEHLRDQLREIADLLGAVRDTDVLLGRLRSAAGSLSIAEKAAAGSALEALQRDRDRARIDLLAWMRSRRYTALLDDLVAAGVQEVLGEHHDALVAEAWLRRAGDTTDPMVLGELVGLQRAAAAAARAAWPRAWKAAQRAHPRSWT